jgi:hypothetical protein
LTPRRPPKRKLRAPQHHNADDALASAPDRHGRNGDEQRALPRSATRSPARRQPPRRGNARFPDRGPPLGLRGATTAYVASANTDAAARRARPARHAPAVRNPSASVDDESSRGSASELPPATSHGYAEWDFSGVPDPVMFWRFLDATHYWFGYSDDSSAGSYDPAWECFVVLANDQVSVANAAEAGDGEVPPGPGAGPHLGAGPNAPPPRR